MGTPPGTMPSNAPGMPPGATPTTPGGYLGKGKVKGGAVELGVDARLVHHCPGGRALLPPLMSSSHSVSQRNSAAVSGQRRNSQSCSINGPFSSPEDRRHISAAFSGHDKLSTLASLPARPL
ncbi:hypothetical protein EYF80_015846 [Liparis tanakae]|uniref:Uncharacterized protein n=1 Tax=Liparis tanakae TaxID=230148 RepID=A0A4Z2I6Z1_9TELE|nr:hypothetical protein EYF80_015846 [Liparis tanakae]